MTTQKLKLGQHSKTQIETTLKISNLYKTQKTQIVTKFKTSKVRQNLTKIGTKHKISISNKAQQLKNQQN